MSKHTPGPWVATKRNPRSRYPEILIEATDEDGELSTIGVAYHFDDCLEANARLIAEAPAMAEALRACIAAYEQHRGNQPTGHLWPDPAHIFDARAILARING